MNTPLDIRGDPDVQLMLEVQKGSQAAYRQLFEKHVAGVVGFAMQFVKSRARAEELAQDVFLQVYRTRERYVPRARFKTWLYRMVTNACLSDLRRPEHNAVRPLDSAPTQDAGDPSIRTEAPSQSSEDVALSREAVEKLQAAVARLPGQQRAALLLARVNGLSYDEIATAMRCSVSAVKSLIHRATVTLRDQLQEERI